MAHSANTLQSPETIQPTCRPWSVPLASKIDLQETIEQYLPRIHRAALVLTGNPWDADDLAQETFLVLAKAPQGFQGRSALYTYLYGILLNLERRRRRSQGVRRTALKVMLENSAGVTPSAPAAETAIEVAEWKAGLWSLVAELPDGQRQALVLRFSEHLRYEEIAEAEGCPLGTVKSRIFNGLAALRERFEAAGQDTADIPRHTWEDLSNAV